MGFVDLVDYDKKIGRLPTLQEMVQKRFLGYIRFQVSEWMSCMEYVMQNS